MAEAGRVGDLPQRHFGFRQQLSHAIHAHARDFVVDGSGQDLPEPAFQGAVGQGHMGSDVLNPEVAAGFLAG